MNRLYKTLTILLLLTGCGYSQTPATRSQVTENIKADLINLLPQSMVTAEIMDGIKQSPRQAYLNKKFQDGIQKNHQWFIDYMKTVPSGQTMPYHPNLSMTEVEYNELQEHLNNIELVSSGTEKIKIKNQDDIIKFKTRGKLAILKTIKIDLKSNTVTIGKYNLALAGAGNVTDETNIFKSKWKGYTWRFREPKDINLEALKDLSGLNIKIYKFTIGRLEKNGKKFMSIEGTEIENGVKSVDFVTPIIF